MVDHTFPRRSSTQRPFLARTDAFWMNRGNGSEVLAGISKNGTETHVRSFAESANKIRIFADSRNQIMSQLELQLLRPEQYSTY